jgi:cystathionine gamma-synthase
MAAFLSQSSGDHVLLPLECYHGTQEMMRQIFPRWGLSFDFIDMTNMDAVHAAVRSNTRLIWVETPSNPCLKLSDLATLSNIAKQANATLLCDNTFATPLNQNPLKFGCDLVLHSTTKYLNGHSDVLGGVLVAREQGALSERLRSIQICGGAVPSPFDCWLTMRGMATMSLRVQTQCASAEKIAEFLSCHRQVEQVHYPSLPSHPQYLLAKAQMRSGGGLLSFEVKGGESSALAFVAAVRRIHRATSLGGVETLIEHRASMEGPHTRTPRGLVRLAVGIEPTTELIDDLDQALASLD